MRIFRPAPIAVVLAAVALLATGCSSAPGAAPTSSGTPSGTSTPPIAESAGEAEAAWLDGGRAIALLTWGSSSCAPVLGDVAASGQSVRVTLAPSAAKACTDDLAPRGLLVPVPEGVDVTADVEVEVEYGDRTQSVDLDARSEGPQGESEQKPSAGWFDDEGIVLLTWGSSSCPPIVNDVQTSDEGARVTFADDDRVCTMDFAPRLTPIMVPAGHRHADGFALTLSGGGLDGKVAVEG